MKSEKNTHKNDSGTKHVVQQKNSGSFIPSKGHKDSFSTPLVQRKSNSKLPNNLQSNMEQSLGQDFSNVGIHTNSQKAVQMNARAFTQNEQVHFAPGEFNPNSAGGQNLIGHEFTHIAQQRAGVVKPTKMLKKGVMVNDDKSLESEADTFGKKAVQGEVVSKYRSAGLGVRNSMRTSQMMSNVIQRNIVDTHNLGYGKWDLNLTKNDAAAAGGKAEERGTLKFTPSKYSPTSNDIRLIQIVRTVDTGTGSNYKWTGGESDRNNVMTTADRANNVAGGFFVDHQAASVSPRTSKSDATITPDYRSFWPNSGSSQNGHKKSTTDIQHASLWDAPGANFPIKFSFVTSAKAMDTGRYYGTVLWGFEVYNDKKGVSKIKNEYHRFREYRGKTFDAALQAFDDFYKNPGTADAPTK